MRLSERGAPAFTARRLSEATIAARHNFVIAFELFDLAMYHFSIPDTGLSSANLKISVLSVFEQIRELDLRRFEISRSRVFVFDEFERRVDQVSELRVLIRFANERLARGIYIFAADLEETLFFAKSHNSVELGGRVSRGHESDRVKAEYLELIEKHIEIIVLELLRFFISGDRIADVAEIRVCGDTAVVAHHFYELSHGRTFVGGVDIETLDEIALKYPEDVLFVELRRQSSAEKHTELFFRKRELHFIG